MSLPEAIHHLITSCWPQYAAHLSGVSIVAGLIKHDLLMLQQQTHTQCPSIHTSDHEGSPSILVLQIGIDAGMGKEDGDNRVMAFKAGSVKGGPGTPLILPIDI